MYFVVDLYRSIKNDKIRIMLVDQKFFKMKEIMTPFQSKIEDLLSKEIISKCHYNEVKEFFLIEDDETRKVIMTPLMSNALLATSPGNRKQPKANLASLTSQMNRMTFHGNNSIGFNNKGELRDGHGRLTACVNSGVNFPTRITFNLADEEFTGVDTGAKRSAYDEMLFNHKFEKEFGRTASCDEFALLRSYLTCCDNSINWLSLDPKAKRELIFKLSSEYNLVKPYVHKSSKAVTTPVLAAFMRALSHSGETEKLDLSLQLLYKEDQLLSSDNPIVTSLGDSITCIRKIYARNSSQKNRSGNKAVTDLFDRTAKLLHQFLYGKEKKSPFPIPKNIVETASSFYKDMSTDHDFDLLTILHRWIHTQNEGRVKTNEVIDGLIKMGYKYPQKTVGNKLRILFETFNYEIVIPNFGTIIAIIDLDKKNTGQRIRCNEYEISIDNI